MNSLSDEILNGSYESVQQLINHGTEINTIDDYGFTPLIEAAIVNNTAILELLVQRGAAVNMPDLTGGTALQWAVENHNLAMCQLLLEAGADANTYKASSQPVLLKPMLREQEDLRKLLIEHGADLNFALDFINAKLLGHRFELIGHVDIVDPSNVFTEINFEGYFLEFTLNVAQYSMIQFNNSFVGKKFRKYNSEIELIIKALKNAGKLIKYQHYQIDEEKHKKTIAKLINQELLLLPVTYEGHAITFVKYGDYLAKCDRGEYSQEADAISIYHINNPYGITTDFLKSWVYEKQDKEFINQTINKKLGLEQLTQILMPSQVTGNCSWANVEASIPTMLFLLMMNKTSDQKQWLKHKKTALKFFTTWREWDKDFALQFCINSFNSADAIHKASLASMLGAVLFQSCNPDDDRSIDRAKRIIQILRQQEYRYVIKHYLEIYYLDVEHKTEQGENLVAVLKVCGLDYKIFINGFS